MNQFRGLYKGGLSFGILDMGFKCIECSQVGVGAVDLGGSCQFGGSV